MWRVPSGDLPCHPACGIGAQGSIARLQRRRARPISTGMTDLVVWFDGGCPLCRREIAAMKRLDRAGRITFLDVASPETDCPLDRGALLARFHARENGVLLSGAAAFAAMWRAIPLLRPLGLAARNRHVGAALEWLYVRFLRHRPTLQRWAGARDAKA